LRGAFSGDKNDVVGVELMLVNERNEDLKRTFREKWNISEKACLQWGTRPIEEKRNEGFGS